ncbi:hypothetical protein HHX47_DHR8000193 [Lentinula edodes]|nr:hypothetical protein HHX47_DHR8000193 [Lentinula edodes]
MVSAYASDIAGKPMGDNWICRFRTRHPDLALKFTTSLEESRARSLTPAAVSTFYDILADTVAQYEIPPENIYNIDEKGVQLGIGQRTAVLVDRNQKSVSSIESGNRDLVTIIETVCANGSALHPSALVTLLSRKYVIIDKYNLLRHYATAREKAFKTTTIAAAFRKTGIHLFNRNAIDSILYEPAKNFTTKSAMPVPVQLPSLLEPVMSSSTSLTPTPSTSNEHGIVLLPPLPHAHRTVSKEYLRTENIVMRTQLEAAGKLLSANFAHMKLMEAENERLRNKAFTKKRKCVAVNTGMSRHLTAEENMKELLKEEMKRVLTSLKPKFKELKKKIEAFEKNEAKARKETAAQEKKVLQAAARERKAAQQRELGRGCSRGRGRGRGHIQKGRGQGQTQAMANQSEDSSSETSSLNHTDHAPENDNSTDSDSDSEAALTSSVPTAPLRQAHPRPKPRPIPPSDSNSHSLHPVDSHESFDVPITGDPGTDNAKDSQTSFGEEDNGVSKEDEAVETAIRLILGHKWIGRGLKFMVEWVDDDVTWESLSNIKDCVALDDYLVHHGLAEPSKLSKKMYLLSRK